jgi:radical SAM superfamily enzyme YgiQ (UPF0313 family)
LRVLLISANTEQVNILPLPLGLNGVAVAARNAGHEVQLLDLMAGKDDQAAIAQAIGSFLPEVIGLSVRNIDDQTMTPPRFLLDHVRDIITGCRNLSSAPIVLGGAGYSIFPESALAYLAADMGIQGEGEMAFPLLLDRMQQGAGLQDIPGLYLPGQGRQGGRVYARDLDKLPLADPEMWSLSSPAGTGIWIPVQTRRGCPMNCSYCSTAAIEGHTIRKRSPDLVVENMVRHAAAGYKNFFFVDNTFNMPLSYAKDLCRKMIACNLQISWLCIFYPGRVDGELVDLMAKAGCVGASLGFESGCERILQAMNKAFRPDAVRQTAAMLRAGGIRQQGFVMLGGPGETRESAEQSLAFADSLSLESVKVTVGIRIYPHTALAGTAVADGQISPEDDLLFPRFYVVREIEDWLHDTVKAWMQSRPHWMI